MEQVMAVQQPTKMTRAKKWSPEVEEAWRFQVAGYRDELDYRSVQKSECERWPQNGFVKKLQLKNGYWYYFNKSRELQEKDINKTKLYAY